MYEKIFSMAKEKKVSQKELAQNIGVSPSVLSDWRSGRLKPSAEAISKLAKYFGVTTDYLLDLTDTPQALKIPDVLKSVPVAFHRGEFEDLTQDEVDNLARIAAGYKAIRQSESS